MARDTAGPDVETVALVGSAGGLGALLQVLPGLPGNLTAGVLVQQHLPRQGSQLVAILQRHCPLRVAWAEDGVRLVAGQVLVCPSRHRLEVRPDWRLAVVPNELGARGLPHDSLLRSLGDWSAERAVAVVLSGMGRDGSAGTRVLVAAGGRVIAQSEDTAEQSSMPLAAAAAGAGLVVPVSRIGSVVADLVAGRPLPERGPV